MGKTTLDTSGIGGLIPETVVSIQTQREGVVGTLIECYGKLKRIKLQCFWRDQSWPQRLSFHALTYKPFKRKFNDWKQGTRKAVNAHTASSRENYYVLSCVLLSSSLYKFGKCLQIGHINLFTCLSEVQNHAFHAVMFLFQDWERHEILLDPKNILIFWSEAHNRFPQYDLESFPYSRSNDSGNQNNHVEVLLGSLQSYEKLVTKFPELFQIFTHIVFKKQGRTMKQGKKVIEENIRTTNDQKNSVM